MSNGSNNSTWPSNPGINFLVTACYALLVLAGVAVWIWVSHSAFMRAAPGNTDTALAYAYLIVAAAIAAAVWPYQGRLLITLSVFAMAAIVITAIVLAGAGPAIAVLIWLTFVARGIGGTLLNLVARDAKLSDLERTAFSIPIGFGMLALIIFVIAALKLLYPGVLFGTLAVITVPFLMRLRKFERVRLLHPFSSIEHLLGGRDLRLFALVVACCGVSFCAAFVWAIAPEIGFDALNYQLGVPQVYVQNHGLIDLPYTFWSYLLGSTGMLYAMALSLTGQPLPQLIHMLFGLLLVFLTFLFGLRRCNARVGLMAAGLLYILPLVAWESRTAYIDLIVAVYGFGAIYAALTWFETGARGWLTIAGFMSGFAVAAKSNAVAAMIPILLVVLYPIASRSFPWRERLGDLLSLALPALLVSFPWFAIRMLWTGNPVFPFLNNVFQSPYWPNVNERFNFDIYGVGTGLPALLRLPWDLTAQSNRFAEGPAAALGALPLCAMAAFVLLLNREYRRTLVLPVVVGIIGILIWFKTVQIARFLIIFMPIAAVMTALAFDFIYRRIAGSKIIAAGARLLAVGMGVSLLAASGLIVVLFGRVIPERFPYRVLLGQETREQFLSRALPIYDALAFLNKQEGGRSKVLSIGNEFRLYTTARIEGNIGSRNAGTVINLSSGVDLAAFLKRNGYDYILINQIDAQRLWGTAKSPILRNDFLSRYGRAQFARNNIYVYKVMVNQDVESANLIDNCGFERGTPQGLPDSWISYGTPLVDRTGKNAHTGLAAVRAGNSNGLYLRLSARPGEPYTLGHWSKADAPDQLARVQINWLADDLSLLNTSINVVPAEMVWRWNQMSVRAPDRAAFAQVYVSVEGNSQVWFDDSVFVKGDPQSLPQCTDTGRSEPESVPQGASRK